MEKKKILIVDDAMDMRIFLSALYNTSGYRAISAKNGKEGIRKAREIRPDLILLDVMMPDDGGAVMYGELKADKSLAGIPVVMLSAVEKKTFYHYLKMLHFHQEEGVTEPEAYLEKPPDPDALLALTRTLLNG